jgi:methionine synthase I (cobalamin-dependent)
MYVATSNVWSSFVTEDMVYQMNSKATELNGDLADELDEMKEIIRDNFATGSVSYADLGFQGVQTTKRYWVSEDVANQWIAWIKANFESTLISIEIV